MPWCPKCKAEYREGFTTCSDCNVTLVPELQLDPKEDYGQEDYDKEAFLMSVTSDLEAQSIESLLRANGIPVLKKYSEAGGYLKVYMGGTSFGIDIYVPSKLLEEAKEIINTQNGLDIEGIEELEDIENISMFDKEHMDSIELDNKKQEHREKLLILSSILLICIAAVLALLKFIFR